MGSSRKRGSEENWGFGRGGLGSYSRNAPGGRGFSTESPPRDGPISPPPAVGGVGDPPPRNDANPVHSSGDRIAADASAVEGSGSGKWVPSFRRHKPAPTATTHSPSQSGGRAQSPSQSGGRAPSGPGGDWRIHRAPSTASHPRNFESPSSDTKPYGLRSYDLWSAGDPYRSEGDWKDKSSASHSDHRSSSGTPPYSTGGSSSDGQSRRRRSSSGGQSPWSRSSSGNRSYPDDSLLSPLRVTGHPQRKVPELLLVLKTPGILGRAPAAVKVSTPAVPPAHPTTPQFSGRDNEDDAAFAQSSSQQCSADIYDPAQGDTEDHQSDPSEREGTAEELLKLWEDALETMWEDGVLKFLNEYKHPGHKSEFYKAQLEMVKALGKPDIIVDFEHLKVWDQQLAYIVCNGQGRDDHWLKQAVNLFLNEHKVTSGDGNIIFRDMPKSLKRGKDIFCTSEDLVTQLTIFNRRETAVTSSFFCSQIVSALIDEALESISFGISWLGDLSMEDIEFTEVNGVLKATITRQPEMSQGVTGWMHILDFCSLWPMVQAAVTLRGELPLYFEELWSDLCSVAAKEVTEPWFRDYMTYHPALVASMGRRNVEIGLYQVMNDWYLDKTHEFRNVFSQNPSPLLDWREMALQNRHLKMNFLHGNPVASGDSKGDLVKGKIAVSVDAHDIIATELGKQKAVDDSCQEDLMGTISGHQSKTAGCKMTADDSAGASSKDEKNVDSSNTKKGLDGLAEQKQDTGTSRTTGCKIIAASKDEKNVQVDTSNTKKGLDGLAEQKQDTGIISGQQSRTAGCKITADDSVVAASKDEKNVQIDSSNTKKGLDGLAEQKDGTGIAKIVPGMENPEVKDPMEGSRYENTISGCLEFRRHAYTHPNVWKDDLDEFEIYLAKQCSFFLCTTLKELLKKCRMTGKFEAVWSAYKTSKSDPRRLSTPNKISSF